MTSENPTANMPEVSQLMWGHPEEPDKDAGVLDKDGGRIFFRIVLRDASGAVSVGIPQRVALPLAKCASMEEFLSKHAAGELQAWKR